MQGFTNNIRACARRTAHLASRVAVASLGMADAMAARMAGDPAATCGDLIRPADNVVRIDSATMVGPTPRIVAPHRRAREPNRFASPPALKARANPLKREGDGEDVTFPVPRLPRLLVRAAGKHDRQHDAGRRRRRNLGIRA